MCGSFKWIYRVIKINWNKLVNGEMWNGVKIIKNSFVKMIFGSEVKIFYCIIDGFLVYYVKWS